MTLPIVFLLLLLTVVGGLIITDRLRPDLAAVLLLVTLGVTGMVEQESLFTGFSRNAVITIMALSIISHGLERTGATRILGQYLGRLAGTHERRAVTVVMVAAASLSLVMNNIAAGAVLLPAIVGLTRQTELKAQKLLIPLAFGAILGGMATLFTTANLLVSAVLVERGYAGYGVLDFLPIGGPIAVVGIAFVVLFGHRLLPNRPNPTAERPKGTLVDAYGMKQAVSAAYVKPGSAMAGLSIAEGRWGQRLGLNVLALSRGGGVRLAPPPTEEVLEGDVILFTGFTDEEDLSHYGLTLTEEPSWNGQLASDEVSLVEVVLAPRSAYAGRSLRDMKFRERYDLTVLAIWREGNTLREGVGDLPLRFGDALLIQGRHSKMDLLREDAGFLILVENTGPQPVSRQAWLAVGLTTLAVLLPAFNLMPIAESTFIAAFLMVLCKCLTMDQAYSAIEWKSIFLIAGMLPLGLAMTNTGTAALLGDVIVNGLGQFGALAVAAGMFWATTLLAQVIGGQVTPVVLAPIAIAAAERLGFDPRGLAMAVALGCSMAFLSPVSHSVNLLVMGPGGYKFSDYPRLGLPLTLVLFVVFLVGMALVWGIR